MGGQAIATRITGDPVSGNNGLFYLHTDHLGSTSLLTYGSNPGNMVAGTETRYLPYGTHRLAPTTQLTERDYTGQKENLELGLLYYNARFYVPSIGRFASADTIVPDVTRPQSANRYSYVENRPIVLIDPSGHIGICFQQGTAEANEITALSQMCTQLENEGLCGSVTNVCMVFSNDLTGIETALLWLAANWVDGDTLLVMGYSWGGGAALEFAHLLYKYGGQTWHDIPIKGDTTIDALILIDAVTYGRDLAGRSAINVYPETTLVCSYYNPYACQPNGMQLGDDPIIPPNVVRTLNLFAPRMRYGFLLPMDQGVRYIEGATNIRRGGTNHCSIAYGNCYYGAPVPYTFFPYADRPDAINSLTVSYIRTWLSPIPLPPMQFGGGYGSQVHFFD